MQSSMILANIGTGELLTKLTDGRTDEKFNSYISPCYKQVR